MVSSCTNDWFALKNCRNKNSYLIAFKQSSMSRKQSQGLSYQRPQSGTLLGDGTDTDSPQSQQTQLQKHPHGYKRCSFTFGGERA